MKVKYVGVILPALMVLVFSCSIIQDSDVKSAAEASSLKLTSIKIDQASQSGGTSTTTITPLVDKTVSISIAAGTLTRYVEFNAPDFFATNSKMKYRTPVVAGAKIYVYYFSSGKPATVGIYKENVVSGKVKDSTFYEVYRFRYDGSGRVNKITTFLDPTAAPTANDTLIYGLANQVVTILRRPNPAQTINVQYQGNAVVQNISVALSSNLSAPTKSINGGGNSCYDCATESTSTLGFDQGNSNGGGSGNSPLVITLNTLFGKPQLVLLENVLNLGNSPDTYYFHPLMLVYGQVPHGHSLLHIYMIDWWKFGGNTGPTGNNNFTDKVKFTFNYVKQ